MTVGYKMSGPPAVVGSSYTVTDAFGREAKYVPVFSLPLDLKKNAPDLYDQGVEAYATAGTLYGPAGKINIMGVSLLPKGITSDDFHVLLYSDILTDEQYDELSVSARISAGPRVVDALTGESYALSADFDALAMWGSPSDLSTLSATMGEGGIDESCVQAAYARYNARVAGDQSACDICTSLAMGGYAICMVSFAVATFPLSIIGMLPGTLICTAALALATAGCMAYYFSSLETDKQLLKIDLAACGVVILEE